MTAKGRHLKALLTKKRSRSASTLLTASLGILVGHWVAVFFFVVPRLGTLEFLRLHYTARLGVDWIGQWWMIFSFPIFGLAVFFVNLYFADVLARQHRSLGFVAHTSTLLTEAALAFGGIAAILLNG